MHVLIRDGLHLQRREELQLEDLTFLSSQLHNRAWFLLQIRLLFTT
jgi:hypothetical protein